MIDRIMVRDQLWLLRTCSHCDDPGPHPPDDARVGSFVCGQCYSPFPDDA